MACCRYKSSLEPSELSTRGWCITRARRCMTSWLTSTVTEDRCTSTGTRRRTETRRKCWMTTTRRRSKHRCTEPWSASSEDRTLSRWLTSTRLTNILDILSSHCSVLVSCSSATTSENRQSLPTSVLTSIIQRTCWNANQYIFNALDIL